MEINLKTKFEDYVYIDYLLTDFCSKQYIMKNNWQTKYFCDLAKFSKYDFFEEQSNFEGTVEKSRTLPRTLYRFCKLNHYNLLDICNGYLYLSNIKSFNDLFDSSMAINTESEIKKNLLKEIKDIVPENIYYKIQAAKTNYNSDNYLFSNGIGFRNAIFDIFSIDSKLYFKIKNILEKIEEHVLDKVNTCLVDFAKVGCFASGDEKDIVNNTAMWGYYAENGSGICIKYNIEKIVNYQNENDCNNKQYYTQLNSRLYPIKYSNRRPILNIKNKGKWAKEIAFMKACTTKSTQWSKEKEYRLIIENNNPHIKNSKIKFPFIDTIFIGPYMDNSLKIGLIQLCKKLNINFCELEKDYYKYKLNEINKTGIELSLDDY